MVFVLMNCNYSNRVFKGLVYLPFLPYTVHGYLFIYLFRIFAPNLQFPNTLGKIWLKSKMNLLLKLIVNLSIGFI